MMYGPMCPMGDGAVFNHVTLHYRQNAEKLGNHDSMENEGT